MSRFQFTIRGAFLATFWAAVSSGAWAWFRICTKPTARQQWLWGSERTFFNLDGMDTATCVAVGVAGPMVAIAALFGLPRVAIAGLAIGAVVFVGWGLAFHKVN